MILITDLQNEKTLNDINKYEVDGLIINSSLYSCFNGTCYNLDEINQLALKVKELGKKVFINLDRIMQEDDINPLKEFLNSLAYYDYLIFSDMAFLNFELDYSKLIYDPKTLVVSSYEKSIFDSYNIKSFLGNELSLSELKKISQKTMLNMTVYGYHQMMYSYRPLLSLYNEFVNEDKDLVNKLFYLKEEIRDDKYLVYQSKHGTFVYTPYIYAAFKELDEIKDKLDIVRFNSFNICENKIIDVIKIYRKLFSEGYNDELFASLKAIDDNIDNGFLKQSSVLLKVNNDD